MATAGLSGDREGWSGMGWSVEQKEEKQECECEWNGEGPDGEGSRLTRLTKTKQERSALGRRIVPRQVPRNNASAHTHTPKAALSGITRGLRTWTSESTKKETLPTQSAHGQQPIQCYIIPFPRERDIACLCISSLPRNTTPIRAE